MPRATNELVIIQWRDIPAQVNGRNGSERHQVVLPHRFQKAIDRAAMVAGKKTAHEYVAEWRRTTRPLAGDPGGIGAEVASAAATIERDYPNERLTALVANGGWEPDHGATAE